MEEKPAEASARPRLPGTGDRILGYEILRLAGGGGMGRLYEALDPALDRVVAIKVLPPDAGPESERRFDREGRLLAKLQHPNLVTVHHAGDAGGLRFLVMEFVVGISLGDLVSMKGAMSASLATEVGLQAARGLQAAHEAGVLHRDVKPDNLVASRDGVVKVLDFGIGKDLLSGSVLTGKGDILGTANYMPPEHCDGLGSDERSDIYGLGITLYNLITGLVPFDERRPMRLFQRLKEEPLPVLDRWPGVTSALAGLIAQMTAKSPSNRPSSMEAVVKEMTTAGLTLAPPPSPHDLADHIRRLVPAPMKPGKALGR